MFGVNTYTHEKPRKRPGRHKKNRNKHEKEWENIEEKVKRTLTNIL